jgi:hypothetical protein
MKCLLKLQKNLHATVNTVRVEDVLYHIHNFLLSRSKNSNPSDIPLRTVRTVLNEFVSVLGAGVLDRLTMIPPPLERTAIYSLIDLMLKSQSASFPSSSSSLSSSTSSLSSSAHSSMNVDSLSGGTAEPSDPRVTFLTDIFSKLSDPALTSTAMQSLHQFLKMNPDFNIHPYLARTSETFQTFVANGLKQLEQHGLPENSGMKKRRIEKEEKENRERRNENDEREPILCHCFSLHSRSKLCSFQTTRTIATIAETSWCGCFSN